VSANAIYLVTIWVILAPSSVTAAFAQQLGFDNAFTTQKVVALTFDADMTSRMLTELKSGKVASGGNVDLDQGDTDRITIRSALNLFFGTTLAPFQAHPLTKLGPRNPGQVTVAERERSYHSICT
jgi:hypothetical protein